jgi:flagellar biogenesis protein FliO
VQQFLAIAFVLAALWGTVWFLRRKGAALTRVGLRSRNQSARIERLDRMNLTPQHSIHLLNVDGRKIVLALHPQGITQLDEPRETIPSLRERQCGT